MTDVAAPAPIGGGLRRLARNTVVYAAADLIAKGGAYALIPILTRGLSPSGFGAYALVVSIVPVLTIVGSLGFAGAVTRLWFDLDASTRLRFQLAAWLAMQASALGVAVALSALTPVVFGGLFPRVDSTLFLFGVWTSFFLTSATVPLAILRAQEQPRRFALLSASQFLGPAAGVVVAIAIGAGARGALWGHAAGAAGVMVLSIGYLIPLTGRPAAWSMVRPALALGLPVVPHLIAHWALNVADRVAIQRALGTAAVGFYTVGYQIAQGVSLVATALNNATVPTFYRAAQRDRRDVLGRAWAPLLFAIGAFSVGVALFGEEVVSLLAAPGYEGSAEFIPWVALGYWFLAAYYFPVNALFFAKRVRIIPVATLAAALLNFGLNVWLLPHRGLIAAAQNTAVGYGVLLLIVLAAAQRTLPLPYRYGRAAAIGATGAAVYALSLALPDGGAGTALKAPLFALYVLAGFAIVRDDVAAIRAAGEAGGAGDPAPGAVPRVVFAAATTTQARTMSLCARAVQAEGMEPVFVSLDPIQGKNASAAFREAGVGFTEAGTPQESEQARRVAVVLHGRREARAIVAGAAAVVIGNDFTPFERLLLEAARRSGCATALVQDGVIALEGHQAGGGARSGSTLVNVAKRILSMAGYPFRPMAYGTAGCDAICVYGPSMQRALAERGIDPAIVHVTGQPRYDAVQPLARRGDAVLVTTQPFSRYGLASLEEETATFSAIIEAARRTRRPVIVKLHPDTDAASREALQSRFAAGIRFEQQAPIERLFAEAAALVTLSSTTALDAMLHGVPVVVVDAPGFPTTLPYRESGAVFPAAGASQIDDALRGALEDPESRSAAVAAFLAEHLAPRDGNATTRVAQVVAGLVRERAASAAATQ